MAGLMTAANPYNVSKHGVVCLTEGIFRDLREMGAKLSVLVACPGLINTRILDAERNRGTRTDVGAYVRNDVQVFVTVFEEALRTGWGPEVVAEQVVDGILPTASTSSPPSRRSSLGDARFQGVLDRRNPSLPPNRRDARRWC